ncbi:MAG: ABC transporter permease subunit [Candidatus Aminicenantes bacterium]|nr:ABC transporter permease subunit [Candidatus Aminicenantes bacterium]
MFNNIFLKTLKDQLSSIFWWSSGFIFLSIYLAYFFPFISENAGIFEMIDSLPPFIKNLFVDIEFVATPAGFFNLQPFSYFAPIMILFYSVSKGVGVVAGENENGTLDLLLSKPVSRTRILVHKTLSISLALAIIHIFFLAGMILGLILFKINLNIINLAAAIISLYILSLSFLTISVAAGIFFLNKKKAIGFVSGFALISFIINAYSPALRSFQTARIFSPFYYNSGNSPIINGLDINLILVQIFIMVSFFVFSLMLFNKRDLYS